MTLDELADLLRLPNGHRLHAVDELPAGYCPGVSLTITSDGDAPGPHLPRYQATDPLMVMDLASYRRWVSQTGTVTRTALRSVDAPSDRRVPRREDHQSERAGRPGRRADDGYIPAIEPIMQSFTPAVEKEWPRFPGQDLPITGTTVGDDPGDEDHLGGPR